MKHVHEVMGEKILKHSLIFTLLAISTSSPAMGAIVDVHFSGATSSITNSKCNNFTNGNCNSWVYTYPSSIQFYGDTPVSIGDTFGGSLRYESAAQLSGISSDGSQATYLNGVTDFSVTIGALTLPAIDLPKSGFGPFAVINDRGSTDSFFMSQWFSGPDWFSTASISLFDWSGTVYSDFSVPTSFDLSRFDTLYFSIGFLRRADGDQVHIAGTLTSFESSVTSVPEPSTLLLCVLGLPLIATKKVRHWD